MDEVEIRILPGALRGEELPPEGADPILAPPSREQPVAQTSDDPPDLPKYSTVK